MALTVRPTGLESPAYNDLKDYTVFSGRWGIGRIYEERGARPDLRWYWTLYGPHAGLDIIRRDGRASTLEEAKAQLAENWRKWLTWAKLRRRIECHVGTNRDRAKHWPEYLLAEKTPGAKPVSRDPVPLGCNRCLLAANNVDANTRARRRACTLAAKRCPAACAGRFPQHRWS